MNYLKQYGITAEEIVELKEIYNENIIDFLKVNSIFIEEKLKYLKSENYVIFPILKNNIKIFLETMSTLEKNIKIMKEKGLNKKNIQTVLTEERLYSKYFS